MPSDFISLLSSDLDLNSPKSLYSKESVYDLLPKELQLQPSSTQTDPPTMSQKSGGEAGPPPSAALASDATSSISSPSASSSVAMGVPCSGLSTGSSTLPSDQLKVPQHLHSTGGGGAGAEMQGMEGAVSAPNRGNNGANTAAGDVGSGVLSGLGVQQPQNTPSKRRPVLSISPPPEDLFDDSQMSCQEEPTISGPTGPDSEHSSNISLESGNAVKGGSLSTQFPQRSDGKELKILVQPETQHRARYLTEGSRGSVKDRTQQGFPTVKLEGVSESVVLQVFVANDAGRVKPHGFYQACRVTGRNTTACKEVDIEGTTVIEIPLEPSNDMTLAVDCVGILKLRNADVEARIGVAGSKKKSTRARLAFRVGIPQPDGSVLTLQVPSSPILCNDNSWQSEAKIDMDLFHQNHLIVTVPPFHNQSITSPASVGIFVMTNAGRSHDAQPFTYTPDTADNSNVRTVKTEGPSLVKTCIYDGQIKSMSTDQTDCPGQPSKRQEDTPMEVSSNPPPTDVFKPSTDPLVSVQQTLELSSTPHPGGESFQTPMPIQPEDVELPQAPPVFPSLETLSTIQKQDIASAASFPVSGDPTIPPVTPEVPQQFLRDPQESLPPEGSNNSSGVVVVAMPQITAPSQPQPQQSQVPLFPQEGVAQLERAVRELQAGSNTTLQQAGELLTIQTSFPTQPPSHTSPPQQLFQSPRPLAETQSSQQQVQASLLQNTLSVLTSGSLNSEQQSTGSTLYLSPNPQPQQQQQLAFISSMETSTSQGQSVAMFQNQPQAQLSQMQQQSTPMEQQQSPPQNQQPQQLPMGQQGSLFQSIPNHSQTNPVPQSQLSQPQQAGLLLCTTDLNPQAIPPTILFSTQTQGPSSMGSISVGIPQPDPAEPMSFQDQSSSSSNSTSTDNQQQSLFQEQQPMQVGPSATRVPNSQPVELFLPQTSLSSLQNTIGSQELNNQAPAPGTTIFVVQGNVGVVANPGQQPPEQLFQTTVGGNVAPQGQANLFVFGIQNESPQLINSSRSTLPAQSQAQNSSHMQPLLDQPMAQTASSMPAAMHSSLQNTLQAQMQSSLENAMQTSLQNAMQTNTQTVLQSSLQATIETSLPTPMQTSLQTQIQSSLQNTLQSSISASSNMDKIEDLLESLQK
ncbi:hypothetical protein PAMP_019610 [Pampus punctatissimus]